MTYRTEFPDFDPATMPAIPAGFRDTSWRQEQCPTFTAPLLGLFVWTDYAAPAEREFPESPRFGLAIQRMTMSGVYIDDIGETLIASDDWRAVQVAMIGEAFSRILQNDMTPDQWTRMTLDNFRDGPASLCCASHDTRDSNMDMAEAFALIMGREPSGSFETHYDAATGQHIADDPEEERIAIADSALWNEAWNYAKARHLSGDDIDYSAPKVGAVVEFQNGILAVVAHVVGDGFAVIHCPGYGDDDGPEHGDYIPAFFEIANAGTEHAYDSLTFVSADENGLPTLAEAVAVCQARRTEA